MRIRTLVRMHIHTYLWTYMRVAYACVCCVCVLCMRVNVGVGKCVYECGCASIWMRSQEGDLALFQDMIKELRSQNEELQTSVETLEREKQMLESRPSMDQYRQVASELKEKEALEASMTEELGELRAKALQFERELAAARASAEEETGRTTAKVAAADGKCRTLNQQVADLKRESEARREELVSWESRPLPACLLEAQPCVCLSMMLLLLLLLSSFLSRLPHIHHSSFIIGYDSGAAAEAEGRGAQFAQWNRRAPCADGGRSCRPAAGGGGAAAGAGDGRGGGSRGDEPKAATSRT
eukprot:GHVU01228113.1.p1 GENE.GHVU01228113.1~~GHVU01228113.1.p1  ORF type:complete len:297 (+),score=53.06 GHVU01228113.1:227-1117(+)